MVRLDPENPRCSFCGKFKDAVEVMIVGDDGAICAEGVDAAVTVIAKHRAAKAA